MNPSKAQLGQPLILQSENNNFQINTSDSNNFLANTQQNNKKANQPGSGNAITQLAQNLPFANQVQLGIPPLSENNKKKSNNNQADSSSPQDQQNEQNYQDGTFNAEHNNLPGSGLQSTRWLTCMYVLAWLLSLLGTTISLIIIVLASDLLGSQFSSLFLTPSSYWAGFNFILLYLPFSGIVMILTSYVIGVACFQNYSRIHHTQTVTLACSVLAVASGVCNFTQMSAPVGCSGASSEACIYLTCSLIYYYGVIELAALPALLLIGTQIKLKRLNNNPQSQFANEQKPAVDPVLKKNALPIIQLGQSSDQNGNQLGAFGNNSQIPLKSNNLNTNLAVLEDISNTGANQIELEQLSDEAFSPLKIKEQADKNISSNVFSNNKASSAFGGNNLLNTKTTQSYFQETPTKDLSPIARAAQNIANRVDQKLDGNIKDNNMKKLFNPFGDIDNGEIKLGKHPYLAKVEDPKAGEMLDQVHQMVNSQVRSLIVDLKKRNQI